MSVDVLVEPFYEWIVDASQIKGGSPGHLGLHLRRGPATLHREEDAHGEHGSLSYSLPGLRARERRSTPPSKTTTIREVASKALEETGRLLAYEYGFDQEVLREYRQNVLARFENLRSSDEVTWVAHPHPQARPRRAVRLPGPAPPRDGPHANAPVRGHQGVTRLRLPERRGGSGVARNDTRGRRTFGSDPLRRHRRESSARGSRRGTL